LTYHPFGGSRLHFTFRCPRASVPGTAHAPPQQARRPSASTIGERLRQLRIARGLTQSELGLGRFSKEYISQIERGRARPTPPSLEWLAERLGVTRSFLETGISSTEHERVASTIARAEAAVAARRYEDALAYLETLGTVAADGDPALALRALLAQAAALTERGRVHEALEVVVRARDIAEGEACDDVDRATVIFQMGRCRYKLSSIATAVALFSEALELLRKGDVTDDRLRAEILRWRSRCYRRHRDWEAAREDIEGALELATHLSDPQALAHAYFQASVVAERQGRWVLARSYAERAKALFEEQENRLAVGRSLNNLGVVNFLLGNVESSIELFSAAFQEALAVGSDPDAAQAISSLAQVNLRTGDVGRAEEQARQALELLGDRIDFLDERGNAQLVLGRSLLEQERFDEAEGALAECEATFAQLDSASHRAAAWTARAELAARRGDSDEALRLYRLATETLQDFRF
jgi:tetratricopeptide (TPR) repeat protein